MLYNRVVTLLVLFLLPTCQPVPTNQNALVGSPSIAQAKVTPVASSPSAISESVPAKSTFSVDSELLANMAFLKTASPKASDAILQGFARSDNPLKRYGLDDSSNELIHFFAQSATETGGFRTLAENMSYSADRLLEVFPSRVTPEAAEVLDRNQQAIANHVYGDRLGNVAGTNDGWDFRGSGYLQLTGRYNYTTVGDRLNVALENQPDLVRQPELGLEAALEYWKWKNVGPVARSGTIREVRFAINGGENGLPEAKIWYEVIADAFANRSGVRLESGSSGPDPVNSAVAEALAVLGFLKGPQLESTFTSGRYNRALADFQQSRGLEPTGVFNTDTLYAITDPLGRFNGE